MLSALNEAAIKLLSKKKLNKSQINIVSPVLSSNHIMNSLLTVLWKNFTHWCNVKGAVQPKIEISVIISSPVHTYVDILRTELLENFVSSA